MDSQDEYQPSTSGVPTSGRKRCHSSDSSDSTPTRELRNRSTTPELSEEQVHEIEGLVPVSPPTPGSPWESESESEMDADAPYTDGTDSEDSDAENLCTWSYWRINQLRSPRPNLDRLSVPLPPSLSPPSPRYASIHSPPELDLAQDYGAIGTPPTPGGVRDAEDTEDYAASPEYIPVIDLVSDSE